MSKGANTAVPTSLLAVVVSWRSDHAVDAHALLLTESGRVRSDRDLVFFNAPRHISQAVTLDQEPQPGTARLSVSLPRTESEVRRIVVSGSLDEGTFGDVADLTVTVHDASGPVAGFDLGDCDPVDAMMFGEFYRRDGLWRFRAIGQGWSSGLAGLVTEFGVRVDEPPNRSVRASNPFARPGRTNSHTLARLAPPGPEMAAVLTNLTTAPDIPAESAPTSQGSPTSRPVDLTRRAELPALPPPPPDPQRADWYLDPHDPARMRWWDGSEWTSETYRRAPAHARECDRCGYAKRRRLFGGTAECRTCAERAEEFLTHWHGRAARVLASAGPHGPDWEALWAALRYQRVDEAAGRRSLRDIGLAHVERLATFAFADGEIAQEEYDAFERAVAELWLNGPLVEELRGHMRRGRTLSRLREGALPLLRTPDLHLDPEERVHLDLPATHIRHLARGPRLTGGRLIASNKKLRFVGAGAGTELPWNRVVSVRVDQGAVVIAATSARGGATFTVDDPDYVAAALEGALRVAKRLVLTPGQRDSRSIPQEVKAEVWQRDGGRCVECGSGHYLEFDHVIPLSRGGATSSSNLQILCRACNRAKGARI
ncbi:TerD family protein [Nocardia arizonensis]|nr:TerD family protein [Nocardia arizonensis]